MLAQLSVCDRCIAGQNQGSPVRLSAWPRFALAFNLVTLLQAWPLVHLVWLYEFHPDSNFVFRPLTGRSFSWDVYRYATKVTIGKEMDDFPKQVVNPANWLYNLETNLLIVTIFHGQPSNLLTKSVRPRPGFIPGPSCNRPKNRLLPIAALYYGNSIIMCVGVTRFYVCILKSSKYFGRFLDSLSHLN